MKTMVRAALRQSHADHDGRRRARLSQALLQVSLHSEDAQGHQAHSRSRARSARTGWSTRCCSASPTTSRSTGCSRASRPPASTSRFRWWRSSCFRGDKLYNEHIYWDQASVLVQIGVLDPKGLPVAGVETAKKLLNETATVQHSHARMECKRQASAVTSGRRSRLRVPVPVPVPESSALLSFRGESLQDFGNGHGNGHG